MTDDYCEKCEKLFIDCQCWKKTSVSAVASNDGVRLAGDLPLRKKSKEYMRQFSGNNPPGQLLCRKLGYEDGYAACLRDNGLIKD